MSEELAYIPKLFFASGKYLYLHISSQLHTSGELMGHVSVQELSLTNEGHTRVNGVRYGWLFVYDPYLQLSDAYMENWVC